MSNESASARDEEGWRVSSRSNGGGMCVQVKFAHQDTILVRDSKDRRAASPIISMPARGWDSMLKNIQNPA